MPFFEVSNPGIYDDGMPKGNQGFGNFDVSLNPRYKVHRVDTIPQTLLLMLATKPMVKS
jgi:hypothetical protein